MTQKPWLNHYDEGIPASIDYPEITLYDILKETTEKYPHNKALVFKSYELNYIELKELVDRFAAGLIDLGIKKGDPVGILMPNTPQFVIAFFAIVKLGAIVTAFNPLYTEREIKHQANDAGVEIMIAMTNFYEKVKAVQPETTIRKVIATNIKDFFLPSTKLLFTLLLEKKSGFRIQLQDGDVWMMDLINAHKAEDCPDFHATPEDVALFQYTGGTTGVPKGAIGTQRGCVANCYQIEAWMTNMEQGKDTLLVAVPMYHAYGMIVGVTYGVKNACVCVLIPDPRDIKDVLHHIERYKVTIFPGVPAMYNAINHFPDVSKYDISSIKSCISGSAPLLRETKEEFERLTGGVLTEGFGLSETPVVTHINPQIGINKVGSIGLPLPDVECRIVSLDDEKTDMAPGEIGELLISGPQVMRGYHNMPTETANVLRDGWLYTGDIAYMDDEGFFYIVGRKKEMIKVGGFQVWPREVEDEIKKHPAVVDVGVVGVPDAYSGELVKAWVVLKEGTQLSMEELRQFCKQSMVNYKVPKQIEFINTLPKTNVGKLLRRELLRKHIEEN